MNYYNEIKNELINNEVYGKVKDYSKNRHDLETRYNVGKLLSEAGKHYGEGIIKEYSKRLTNELGKGYTTTNLKYMRQFYLYIQKSQQLADQLSWSHYRILLSIDNIDKVNYYINKVITNHIGVRELERIIKLKEYERLDDNPKIKLINNEDYMIQHH